MTTFTIPAAAISSTSVCFHLGIDRLGNDAGDTIGASVYFVGFCANFVRSKNGDTL